MGGWQTESWTPLVIALTLFGQTAPRSQDIDMFPYLSVSFRVINWGMKPPTDPKIVRRN